MSTPTDAGDNVAPGDLEIVRQLVNSFDIDEDVEQLSDPHALAGWLQDHDLAATRLKLGDEDLVRVKEFREALRGALLANAGQTMSADAVECLNETLEDATLTLRFQSDGSADLEPTCGGLDAVLSRIAAIVQMAMLDGTWPRLKVCPAEDCLWAFYDLSRNRSGTWCDMAVCGNRAKVRAFRERHSAA